MGSLLKNESPLRGEELSPKNAGVGQVTAATPELGFSSAAPILYRLGGVGATDIGAGQSRFVAFLTFNVFKYSVT